MSYRIITTTQYSREVSDIMPDSERMPVPSAATPEEVYEYRCGWNRSARSCSIPAVRRGDKPCKAFISGYMDHACNRPKYLGLQLTPTACARYDEGWIMELPAMRDEWSGVHTYIMGV